jgi:hypothetical protein
MPKSPAIKLAGLFHSRGKFESVLELAAIAAAKD